MSVRDNGIGMAAVTSHNGLGLTGIKERVKDINGAARLRPDLGAAPLCISRCPCPATENSKEDVVANSAR